MQYIKNTTKFSVSGPTAVSIGKFDGVHLGHQKLIRAMKSKKNECRTVLFTFDVPPASLISRENKGVLTTNEERAALLKEQGVDALVECPFAEEISSMEPETFVRDILVEALSCKYIFAGPDCRFGYQRKGDAALLSRLQQKYGYRLVIVEKACYEDVEISSTYIREALSCGETEKANAMLGRDFFYSGIVVEGERLGRRLGFPTANLLMEKEKVKVPFGVYEVLVETEENEEGKKRLFPGIANIGTKPTVSDKESVGIETHLLDFDGNLYGKNIKVYLKSFIRPEKKFNSVEELQAEVKLNIDFVCDNIYKRRKNGDDFK